MDKETLPSLTVKLMIFEIVVLLVVPFIGFADPIGVYVCWFCIVALVNLMFVVLNCIHRSTYFLPLVVALIAIPALLMILFIGVLAEVQC